MFILGLVFNLILNLSLRKSNVHNVFYWLIPVIFLHGLSAETDLTRTYGFMIRFLIVMAVFNWILKKFFSKSIY
jgi:flagellar biogenesis protein FliO